jgi:hypothetical protein
MSPEARERSFDELARGLASGSVTRRRALRLMGAALVGGRWDHSVGWLLPTTSVSPPGRSVGRTSSAVAASVKAAHAPLT